MNNPIQTMLHEHAVICKAEAIIENLDQLWETDAEKYESIITSLINFFREYADGYHHHKEERFLFPAIYNHPDFVLQEIIDEFETHHEDFRAYVQTFEESIAEKDYATSYKALNHYMQDLLDHIAAENDELFVLAENLMTEDELETLYFNFKDVDRDLGEDRKIEFEQLIDNLSV